MTVPADAPNALEHEVILHLVGTARRREGSRRRVVELLPLLDPDVLAAELVARRLLPLVVDRLESLAPGLVPPLLAAKALALRSDWRRRGAVQLALTSRLTAGLAAEGIPAASFKGQALTYTAFGDLGLRSSADIDLLVPSERLAPARRHLEAQGFGRTVDPPFCGDLPKYHSSLPGAPLGLPEVDLHWRVHWYDDGSFARAAVERSTVTPDGLRRLSPSDELAVLLLLFARDGLSGLRAPADLAAWWDSLGSELDQGFLDPVMYSHPALRRALLAAAAAAERLVGLPAERLFTRGWQMSARTRTASRMANWTDDGTPKRRTANETLVDLLLTPPAQAMAYARHHLWMTHTYPAPGADRASGRASRYLLGTARFGRYHLEALARTRSGRDYVPIPRPGGSS